MGRKSRQTTVLETASEPLDWPEAKCHTNRRAMATAPMWDYDIFGEEPDKQTQRFATAIAICETCPIKRQCYDWARDHNESGIWGGAIFPTAPNSALVACDGCGVRIHGLRKDHVRGESAGRRHLCVACAKK